MRLWGCGVDASTIAFVGGPNGCVCVGVRPCCILVKFQKCTTLICVASGRHLWAESLCGRRFLFSVVQFVHNVNTDDTSAKGVLFVTLKICTDSLFISEIGSSLLQYLSYIQKYYY